MREDRIAGHLRLIDRISADVTHARPLVRELLALPPSAWDEWLASHPDAHTAGVFEELLGVAERDRASAPALTDLVLRHIDSVSGPSPLAIVFLRGHAWSARAAALRDAGDLHGALDAYQKAAGVYRSAPVELPELDAIENDITAVRSRIDERRGTIPDLLRDTPFAEWPQLAARDELRNEAAVAALCQEAAWRAHRVPLESLAIADLATAIADSLGKAELRAEAWKNRGLALRFLARYAEALPAFDRAEAILQPLDAVDHARAVVRFSRALTLLEIGRLEEAVVILTACRGVFEQHADLRNELLTGIAEGALFWRLSKYREAWETWTALLRVAGDLGDEQALMSLHNNLGFAGIEIGDFDAAQDHLRSAIGLAAKLGQPLLAARSQLAQGRLMVRRGDADGGLAHLHAVREQFLTQNLVEEAGMCGLEIVEAHLWRGALIEAEAFARQIVREFTAAQLNRRAITALRYLSEAIAARKASAATVEQVRDFILALRKDPESEFLASA